MNRTILSKGLVIVSAVGALAAVSAIGSTAAAQWAPPPPEYIATTAPVYYEGHAAYWYGNHWYWHDEHGAWNHYDHEPAALADRRAHGAPARQSYGHGGAAVGHGGRR
jgi:hypothetical protein